MKIKTWIKYEESYIPPNSSSLTMAHIFKMGGSILP